MATRPKSGITADTDVNLDFLTKEEKEALLSKKMDMIRQRNKALTERHKLIEADKKKAEEAGQAVKPTVDSQTLPAEGTPKPRGRGRGQTNNKDGYRLPMERPKSSGDMRDSSNYEPIVDTSDLINYRSSKGHGGPLYDRDTYNNTPKSKRKPAAKEEATVFPSSSFEYEPIIDMKDLDKRFGALLEAGTLAQTDHGPPPDPSFNPLADRRRCDKKDESSDHRRHPRNYGGSSDLSRVKQNMKNLREKEKEKPVVNKPLDIVMTGKERRNHEQWKAERERYDKERIQRQMSDGGNWKRAWDVDKHSQENDDQTASFTPKMEPAKRPAGRIGSGRFDRGERDERPRSAVIPKGALQLMEQPQQPLRQFYHEQQQVQTQHTQVQHPHIQSQHSQVAESKPSRGRGRGRGRGRSRGNASGEKFPRPRTWSGGDDRFVECQKELLLVKFDNTAGDNSVEVEYDDDEFLSLPASPPKALQSPGTTPGRGPTGRTPNQAKQQQPRGAKQHPQKNKSPRHKDRPPSDTQPVHVEDKWKTTPTSPVNLDQLIANFVNDESRVRTSSHSQSYGDSEEWEDCTESSGMLEEEEEEEDDLKASISSSTTEPVNILLECKLNPEAPEFLPNSPDLTPLLQSAVLPWTCNPGTPCPVLLGVTTSQHREESSIVQVVTASQHREESSIVQGFTASQPFQHTDESSIVQGVTASQQFQHREESSIVLGVTASQQCQHREESSIVIGVTASQHREESSILLGVTASQHREESSSVIKDDQPSSTSLEHQHVTTTKEAADNFIEEIPKSVDKDIKLKDPEKSCLLDKEKITETKALSDDTVTKLSVSNGFKIATAEVVSPQLKNTLDQFSPFITKDLKLLSLQEETKGTSKESTIITASSVTHDGQKANELLQEVAQNSAEDSSQTNGLCLAKAINGDLSDHNKLIGQPTVEDDNALVSQQETTAKILKEEYVQQEIHTEPTSLSMENGDSSKVNVPAEITSSLIETGSA